MARQGPEARLITRMRRAGKDRYGKRLVQVKYHGSAMGEAGVHDLLGTLDGVFVSIEVKAPETYGGSVERAVEKGPTLKQRAFAQRVRAAGGVAGFAADLDGYMALLEEAERMVEWVEDPPAKL